MKMLNRRIQTWMLSFEDFTARGGGVKLRDYQLQPAEAILESVRLNRGLEFAVIMPRQAGKDELLTALIIYLMRKLSDMDRSIVVVNPTYRPQTLGAILRLENRMDANLLTRLRWKKRSDHFRMIGSCRTIFLSGDGQANVVGATANLLLVINEAQDIRPAIYEKHFAPMAASRNATRVFCGTAWTSTTLLAQMTRAGREAEKGDGFQRVFWYSAGQVRRENRQFGEFVDAAVRRLGRNHPFVKTQLFCEEIDAEVSMFPPGRQALMHGSHAARTEPEPGKTYAFLIDVAGQAEENQGQGLGGGKEYRGEGMGELRKPGRDSTALKIVEIDRSTLALLGKPSYLTVFRKEWNGEKQVHVFGALRGLAETWKPARIVIDATGVGEGLWSMLENACGAKVVMPVKFSARLKSELGYGFLGMIESGRYHEYAPFPDSLRLQMEHCRSEIAPGPAQLMRWGVPDGCRDAGSGELVHDDDLMTSALCVMLDGLEWFTHLPAVWTTPRDPLKDMDRAF